MTVDTPERVAFKPRRLTHANLFVDDVERSVRFYNEVCGIELVRREPDVSVSFMSNGNTHHDVGLVKTKRARVVGRDGLVMFEGKSTGRGTYAGLNHLGFEMENEVELVDAVGRAKRAGVKILMTMDHLISRSVYLSDPDGHYVEFYADSIKDWRTIFCTEREDLVTGAWTPGTPAPSAERNYDPNPELRSVPEAIFHPSCIDHAVLNVADLDRALQFYTVIGGLSVVEKGKNARFAVLRGSTPQSCLSLVESESKRSGVHHLGFVVPEGTDFDEAAQRLRRIGVEPLGGPGQGAKQALFVKDPDGMLLEFYTPGPEHKHTHMGRTGDEIAFLL